MTQKQIFSKITPNLLLVTVLDSSQVTGREDASGPDQILQVSVIHLPQAKTIRPHKHKNTSRNTTGTQEAWVVISGLLKANIYDVDDSLLDIISLGPGMCMTLYNGGHNFEVISSDALIYEIKNGPYYGAEFDSQPIDQ
ncbi:hypothetical protein ICN17_01430 [Polynucleobacter sp. 73C-SIWE]|uniref:hypothetical protein n=1 Tax=Polynucleobacter sp. 73C-SIWE TaxID=2689098 RepID=UPI001C0AEF48|nr:hypothetical protein [Polynucleobacter sp. 73C-SIWE]MBU3578664.1 hypothetical protein [Polynucleobacter sp. 73C-SIWE]